MAAGASGRFALVVTVREGHHLALPLETLTDSPEAVAAAAAVADHEAPGSLAPGAVAMRLVDRVVEEGDLVQRSSDGEETGRPFGMVMRLEQLLDVERSATGARLLGVPHGRLAPVSGVHDEDWVVLDEDVGCMEGKWERVTVAFPDGGVCIVDSNAAIDLRSEDDPDSEFEPGVNVRAPRRVWRDAKWVRGSCNSHTRVGTVVSMRAEEVEIAWGAGPALRDQSTAIPASAGRLLAYPRRSDFGAWQLNRPALLFATDDKPVAPGHGGAADAVPGGAAAESPADEEVTAIEKAAAAAEAVAAARRGSRPAGDPTGAAAAAPPAVEAAGPSPPRSGAAASHSRITPIGVGEPTQLSALLAVESCAGALGSLPKTVSTGLCATDVEVAGPSMDPKFLETSGITVESLGPGAGLMEDPSISASATAGGNGGGGGGGGGLGGESDDEDADEDDSDDSDDSDDDSSSTNSGMSISGRMSMWETPPTMGRRPPQGVEDDRWRLVTVQRTKTFAEVQWQDGTVTREEATHLDLCHDYMPSEFLPGQFVVEAASLADGANDAAEVTSAAAGAAAAASSGVPAAAAPAAATAEAGAGAAVSAGSAAAEGAAVAARAAALAAAADECKAWLTRFGAGRANAVDDAPNLAPVAGVPAGVVKALLAVSGTVPVAGSMIQQLFSLRLHTCSTSGAPSISLWVGSTSDLVPLPTVLRLTELVIDLEGDGEGYSQGSAEETEEEEEDDDDEDDDDEEEEEEEEDNEEGSGAEHGGQTSNGTPTVAPGLDAENGMSDDEEWMPPHHLLALKALPKLVALPHSDYPDPVPNLSVLPPAMRAVARSANALHALWALDTKTTRAALVNGLITALGRLSARLKAAAGTATVPPRIGLVLACDRKGKMACVHWLPPRQEGAAAEGSLAPPSPEALRRCIDTMGIGRMVSGLFHDAVARAPTDGSESTTECEWVPVFDIREFSLFSPRTTDIVMGAPGAKLAVTQAALGTFQQSRTAGVQAAIGAAPPAAPGVGAAPLGGSLAQLPSGTLPGFGADGAPLVSLGAPTAGLPAVGVGGRHRDGMGGMHHAALPDSPFSPLPPGSPFAVCAGVVYAVLPSGHVLIRWADLSFSAEHPLDIVSLVADQDSEMSHSMDGASSFDIIFASPLTKQQEDAAAEADAAGANGAAATAPPGSEAKALADTSVSEDPSELKSAQRGATSIPVDIASSGGLVPPGVNPDVSSLPATDPAESASGNAAVAAEPAIVTESVSGGAASVAPAAEGTEATPEAAAEPVPTSPAASAAAPAISQEEAGSAVARAVTEDDWTAAVSAAWSAWGFSGMVTEPGPAPSDFVRSGASGCAAGTAGPAARPGASLLRRLMGEARSLSAGLPPGSALFRFEDDPLALRLVLAGFPNTPYMHGMFVFDIVLPETYPARPPHVHFQCRIGQRLNPNLYAEGKVCLSLLGTWEGEAASEAWQPGTSTLLQLVVSLQAFVLNRPDPYFNEPGTEELRGAPDTDKRAKDYNENAHLLSLRAARLQLVDPPAGGAGRLCGLHMTAIAPRVAAMQVALQASRALPASTASTRAVTAAARADESSSAFSGAGAADAAVTAAPSTVADAGAADAVSLAKLLPSPPSAGFFAVLRREAAALVAAAEAKAASAAASAAAAAKQA